MNSKFGRTTLALGVVILPMTLAAGAASILLGGLPAELRRQELQEARNAFEAAERAFLAELREVAAEPPEDLVVLHADEKGRLDAPFRSLRSPDGVPEPPRELETLALGLERAGQMEDALRLWNAQPANETVLLARARCLLALEREVEAQTLLRQAEFSIEPAPGSVLSNATLAAVLRTRASLSTPPIDTVLIDGLRTGILRPPAALVPELLELAGLEKVEATQEACDALRCAARLWLASSHASITLSADLVRSPQGDVLLRAPERRWVAVPAPRLRRRLEDFVTRHVTAIEGFFLQPAPDEASATKNEDALLTREFANSGLRYGLVARGASPSRRMEQFAGALLAAAGIAFLLGGAWALRLVRRESAVSKLRRDFVDLVSHELRTPLAAVSMKAEMLARGHVPQEKLSRYHESLYAEVRRLAELMARLMDFARIERGKAPARKESWPARHLIAAGLRSGRSAARMAGMPIHTEVPRDLPSLNADPELVARAIRNLIENAAHHAGSGDEILLRARKTDAVLEISVADRGPGVPRAERQRVFEPFHSSGRANGSGLGLAIVAQTMKLHGGEARVEEREGGGARFSLRFPLEETS